MKRFLLLFIIAISIFLVSCQVDWSLIDTSMFEKEPEIYTVSFDSQGGSAIEDVQSQENSPVKRPKNPTKDGFEFDGWYTENDEKYQFFSSLVECDFTLYAKWIPRRTVTFVTDYGSIPEVQYVGSGRYATEPKIEYEHYYIDYWYDDYDNIWDFKETPILYDITLYAKWEKMIEIKVENDVIYLKPGTEIGELPVLKQTGAYFLGWFRRNDKMELEQVDSSTVFYESTYIVPKWDENEYVILITLDPKEGKLSENKQIYVTEKGARLTDLPEPTSFGSSYFLGWYDENGVRYSKNSVVFEEITLSAKYQFHTQCQISESGSHNFSLWEYSNVPTCTDDATATRYCLDCNEAELKIIEDAYGHKYNDNWTFSLMKTSRTCYVCEYVQEIELTDITDTVMLAEIIGEGYGKNNVDCLFNKNWNDESKNAFCGKENNEISVKISLKPNTSPHGIYLKGAGNNSVEVYVKYQGESQYSIISVTSFGENPSLILLDGRAVSEILLKMPNGGDGTEIWQEIAIVKIPKL